MVCRGRRSRDTWDTCDGWVRCPGPACRSRCHRADVHIASPSCWYHQGFPCRQGTRRFRPASHSSTCEMHLPWLRTRVAASGSGLSPSHSYVVQPSRCAGFVQPKEVVGTVGSDRKVVGSDRKVVDHFAQDDVAYPFGFSASDPIQ